jgi:hypothetical protein
MPRLCGLYQKTARNLFTFPPILPRFWTEFQGTLWTPLKPRVEKAAPQFFAKFVMRV